MTMDSKRCFRCCASFTIYLGVTALFLWLTLRSEQPKFYINSFYVPALNKSTSSHANSSVYFTAEFENSDKVKGIRYQAINFTFGIFVNPNRTRPIGTATVDGFRQGHGKKAKKRSQFVAHGVNRTLVNGKVYFRVNFTTSVNYNVFMWFAKRSRLSGAANMEVNDSGQNVFLKKIRLGAVPLNIESGAPTLGVGGYHYAVMGFFVKLIVPFFP